MKKRRLWQKRKHRGWRSRPFDGEFGRRHPNPNRRYCESCGRGFNIHNPKACHVPTHLDYWGEGVEEKNECQECCESFDKWHVANCCQECGFEKQRHRHGKPRFKHVCDCEKESA